MRGLRHAAWVTLLVSWQKCTVVLSATGLVALFGTTCAMIRCELDHHQHAKISEPLWYEWLEMAGFKNDLLCAAHVCVAHVCKRGPCRQASASSEYCLQLVQLEKWLFES